MIIAKRRGGGGERCLKQNTSLLTVFGAVKAN